MYYYGRDKRRRAQRILKRALIAFTVIAGIGIFYFLFFTTEELPGEPIDASISTYHELSDTAGKKVSIQKDESALNIQKGENVKTGAPKNEEKSPVFEKKGENKKPATPMNITEKSSNPVYEVVSVAHFYNKPDEQTRRKDFINYWNESYASIKPIDEKNDFIYVVFKYPSGQTTKGWLRKKDLKKINTIYENSKE